MLFLSFNVDLILVGRRHSSSRRHLVKRSRRPNYKYNAEEITYRAGINPERLPQDARDEPLQL